MIKLQYNVGKIVDKEKKGVEKIRQSLKWYVENKILSLWPEQNRNCFKKWKHRIKYRWRYIVIFNFFLLSNTR